MAFLWSLIVGGLIGWIAGMITGRDVPGGTIGNIIAGFVGAWLGGLILGNWGPTMGGFYLVPAIVGAVTLVLLVSFIMRAVGKRENKTT
jgi:uncharacterized membrane protein YeaQ/YmgE (transglycosylase-associated protein family)